MKHRTNNTPIRPIAPDLYSALAELPLAAALALAATAPEPESALRDRDYHNTDEHDRPTTPAPSAKTEAAPVSSGVYAVHRPSEPTCPVCLDAGVVARVSRTPSSLPPHYVDCRCASVNWPAFAK